MTKKEDKKVDDRMVIKVTPVSHKKAKIKALIQDQTLTEYVSDLIEKDNKKGS